MPGSRRIIRSGEPRVTEKCFHSRLRRGGGGVGLDTLSRNGDEHFYPTNYPVVVHAVGQLRLEIVDEVATAPDSGAPLPQ